MSARFLLIALCAIAVASVAADDTYGASSPVKMATKATLPGMLKANKVVLVEFFAPWCGHCQELKPHYEKAAADIKKKGLDAALVAVDATQEEALAQQYNVEGYPTMHLFKDGKMVSSPMVREKQQIVAAVEKALLPRVIEANTTEEVFAAVHRNSDTVLGVFDGAARDAFKAAVDQIAEKMPDAGGVLVNSELGKKYNVTSSPGLAKLKASTEKELESKVVSVSATDKDTLVTAIDDLFFEPLAEINAEVYQRLEQLGLPLVWLFLPGSGTNPMDQSAEVTPNTPELEAKNKAIRAAVTEIALKFRGKVSCIWMAVNDFPEQLSYLGMDADKIPAVAATHGDAKKYIMDQTKEVTEATVTQFITDMLAGKLQIAVKSEPIPEKNDGPVKVLVAKTMQSDFWDSKDDVFLEFYAPWCGHCKNLAPKWEAVAKALKGVKGITIAKIDATANDVPEGIEGFPTLYFKKAGDTGPKLDMGSLYEGEHTVGALLNFIKKNSKADLSKVEIPKEEEAPKHSKGLSGLSGDKIDYDKLLEHLDKWEEMGKTLRRVITEHRAVAEDGSGGMFPSEVDEDDFFQDEKDANTGDATTAKGGHTEL